ncbi:MAG: hypothetical protein HYZ00_06195 [Candidatus Hydrogenedentes bacterium]|nr:hypothetical protein [Candidatus Hydrogenedentota bacterium]
MRQRWACLQYFSLVLSVAALAGCPQVAQLITSRDSIAFGTDTVTASFTIRNGGSGTLSWSVEEVVRASADAPWVAADIPWLTVDPPAGSTTTEMDRVGLTATREGLPVATFQNNGVRVVSNGGVKVIPVSITVAPTLTVSPTTIPLAPTATFAEFTVSNSGPETVTWDVLFLPDPDDPNTTLPVPSTIQVEPNPGSTAANGATSVAVAFAEGQEDFSLLVRSDRGSAVVSFLFGAALEGLEVNPSPLTLFVNPGEGDTVPVQVPSPLHIMNSRATARAWSIEVVSRLDPGETPPITVTPSSGTTPGNEESTVDVVVTDPNNIEAGSGRYDLILRSGDGFLIVPLIIEIMPLPEIVLSEPPEVTSGRPEIAQIDFLDFGRETVQAQFFVANIGTRGSRLFFKITYEEQGEDHPLLASVGPLQGDTNGPEEVFFHPPESNLLIDAEGITVIVDRTAMTEDVEERLITVEAFDEDFENPLEVVESKTLRIRVERPPLKVEGALNRGRPPFINRFAFLLRDDLSRVIETRTKADRSRISFRITENDLPLDLDETNIFVDGPDGLKVNLVVLLDFTGSMFFAGTTSTTNPLEPGEALADVKEATKEFLDDLPPTYQIALMYYNDRQQRNRLLAPFSADREALKAALDEFSLPASQHGTSAIFDALVDAVNVLVAEDPADTLPFDDADVRAVVFISDGHDTGSEIELNDVVTEARDNHVQLYPLGYSAGEGTNLGDLVVLSEETGGHLYNAGNVANLSKLLANEKALAFEAADIDTANATFFRVANLGQTALPWEINVEEGVDWITSVSPSSGATTVNGSTLVRVDVDPALVPPSRVVEGTLFVESSNGTGEVIVRLRTAADGSLASLSTVLNDEPGTVWAELRNQIVLSYLTPLQSEGVYQIFAQYTKPDNQVINGMFEEDAVFFPGDVFGGQLALRTGGIFEDPNVPDDEESLKAEVFVRAEYSPRGVNRFRLRFFLGLAGDVPAGAQAALGLVKMDVALAPEGLLVPKDEFDPTWRLVPEGDGIYVMLTEEDNPLPYGAFGNLLKITFTGLEPLRTLFNGAGRDTEFLLGMRADNDIYFSPATPGHPSESKYFMYPGGITFPDRFLLVSEGQTDLAPPARTPFILQNPGIDPEAPFAFDRDEDGLPDFQDPAPDFEEQPGPLVFPDRLEIEASEDSGVLVVRNNRFDTFTWSLDASTVPAFITVSFESPTPDLTLSPGESETIVLNVDRTGLPGGFTSVPLRFDLGIFGEQIVPVVVIVSE